MFDIRLALFYFGSLVLFMGASATDINPLLGVDVLGTYRTDNHHQCRRLCWYWKSCGRYSYYSNNDNAGDNCVLHQGQRNDGDQLLDGWTDGEAFRDNLTSTDHGCASRPCGETEMCVPVYSHVRYLCVEMPSAAWLGQKCEVTCKAPRSAGYTGCYQGRCLCAAGYFYSVPRRSCLQKCKNLSDSYLRYEHHNLKATPWLTAITIPATDTTICKAMCGRFPNCITFVFDKRHCYFRPYTALEYPLLWEPSDTADTYQKTCLDP